MLSALTQSGMVNATRARARTRKFGGQTFNVVEVLPTNVNLNVVLAPRGTGYISRVTPDGGDGGNQRGNYAVDWSVPLTGYPTYIASGNYSTSFGQASKASGAHSIAGGYFNNASAQYSISLGHNGTSSASFSSVLGGSSGTASAQGSTVAGGFQGVAGGTYAFIGAGYGNSAGGSVSSAFGYQASAPLFGQSANAGGMFAAAGDAQASRLVAHRASAADTTPVNLFLDGSSARITIPANTTWDFTINIIARTPTATGTYARFVRSGILHRGVAVGTTTIVTNGGLSIDQGSASDLPPSGWAVAVTADTTNGALDIQCTGSATSAARWVARIELTEVAYA